MSTDPRALPLAGIVAELRPRDDGFVRVTFTRLAAVYQVAPDAPRRGELLAHLERSQREGEAVTLTWSWPDRSLSLV